MRLEYTKDGIYKYLPNRGTYLIKFKIVENYIVAYNALERDEYRAYAKVTRINDVSVDRLINQGLKAEQLYIPEEMSKYGINLNREYTLTFSDGTEYNLKNGFGMTDKFRRSNIKSKVIKISNLSFHTPSTPSSNTMLDYAATSFKAIITNLFNLSKSEEDKMMFYYLLDTMDEVNNNYTNMKAHLDMLYLSTAMCLSNEDITNIPDYIAYEFARGYKRNMPSFEFVDKVTTVATNTAVVTDGNIDYKKVITMCRNCIAHSNYEVIDDNTIRLFNEGKDSLNILVNKKNLLYALKELNDYNTLENIFPIIIKKFRENEVDYLTEENIDEFLDYLDITVMNKIEFTNLADSDKQKVLEGTLINNAARMRRELSYPVSYYTTEDLYNKYIKKHLTPDCRMVKVKMTQELKDYIKQEIKELDGEYFYHKVSRSTQDEIIAKIIKQKYNKKSTSFARALDNIIINNGTEPRALGIDSTSYITYKSNLEFNIIALLNSLLLYPYNHNKGNIDVTDLRFENHIYEQFLDSKINRLKEGSVYKVHLRDEYEALMKTISSISVKENVFKDYEDKIRKADGKSVKLMGEINSLDCITQGTATDDQYKMINVDILNKMRDSLAHGRVEVSHININDIGSTKLRFLDIFEGMTEMDVTITLKELLETLSDKLLLTSYFNNNQHFSNHTLTLTP